MKKYILIILFCLVAWHVNADVAPPPVVESEVVVEKNVSYKFLQTEWEALLAKSAGAEFFLSIRAIPYFLDGKPTGLKILKVEKDSFFDRLGFRRGDVFKTLNDQTVTGETFMTIIDQLKTQKKFTITRERRGVEQTATYDVTQ